MCPVCEKVWSERRLQVCEECNRKLEMEKLLPDTYMWLKARGS